MLKTSVPLTLNCKGRLIDLDTPKIMGILNCTPDSFYDGGKYKDIDALLKQAETMLREGASFIDVGAYSSRPGAVDISEQEELGRIVPIVETLIKTFPELLLSVDTFRSTVARLCLERGAAMINDISAGALDKQMMPIVAQFKVPYIMMHLKGNPQTMQQQSTYADLLVEIGHYFSEKIARATAYGINDILLDPGFGFAKTVAQNYQLLNRLEYFADMGLPLVVGLSRKSMISKVLKIKAEAALNGSTALHMVALQQGAHILRVHDVKEAMECTQLYLQLTN